MPDKEKSPTKTKTIDENQDELMTTLESIRGLLAQSENKLSAARKSISIANTHTQNSAASMTSMEINLDDEIVPILDDIVEASTDSLANIPELDMSSFDESPADTDITFETTSDTEVEVQDIIVPNVETVIPTKNNSTPSLSSLTQKNKLINALDDLQLEMEKSLRETLMKTMVTLETELKEQIKNKIDKMKTDIHLL